MIAETPAERARRKFVSGVVEQISNILGAMAASVRGLARRIDDSGPLLERGGRDDLPGGER